MSRGFWDEWKKRGAAGKEDITGVIRNEWAEDTDLLSWETQAKEISQGTCPHIKCSPFQSLNRAHSLNFLLSGKLHRKLGKDFNIPPHVSRSLIRGTWYNLLFYCGCQLLDPIAKSACALLENHCDLNRSRMTLYYTSSKNDCPYPKGL